MLLPIMTIKLCNGDQIPFLITMYKSVLIFKNMQNHSINQVSPSVTRSTQLNYYTIILKELVQTLRDLYRMSAI